VGGYNPEAGYVGIPSVILTKHAGDYFIDAIQRSSSSSSSSGSSKQLSVDITPAADDIMSETWIDVAYTQWEEDDKARLMQVEGLLQKYANLEGNAVSNELTLWLQRRRDGLADNYRKNMDTDA
jgi:hypothetical protein